MVYNQYGAHQNQQQPQGQHYQTQSKHIFQPTSIFACDGDLLQFHFKVA